MRSHPIYILCLMLCSCGGFGPHADLIPTSTEAPQSLKTGSARITYLGTNGYLIESDSKRILVDPYFSRVGIGPAALNLPITPDTDLVDRYLKQLGIDPQSLDLILVTHGHFDHLMDVPHIAKVTGATIVASPTTCYLLRALGVRGRQTVMSRPGQVYKQGILQVKIMAASHDSICCGAVPFPGRLNTVPHAPASPSHYVLGEPLAFVLQLAGRQIYIDSGGTSAILPPGNLGPVDVAIAGVALPDSRARLADALKKLKPRFFLPSHQDDFFSPLEAGFRYGPMTDPSHVRRIHASLPARGQIIMLDYFKPWTLK